MAIDVSQILGSPQLAATRVTPRGTAWRQVSRQSFNPLALLVAPLVARIMMGPRPELGGAQTPQFGVAILAVTKDELVLVGHLAGRKARTPTGVITRLPLVEVAKFDLQHARIAWPLTITFRNGDTWRLEVPRFNKKAATTVATIVAGLPHQGQPASRPAMGI
jgi:hypothetical protein